MPTQQELPEQFGRYRILKKLGEGGMGAVYLAEDMQLERRVALKVPSFSEDNQPKIIERFYREARLAQTIHHPYVCQVYEVGEIDGRHYLTMEFIDGTPLNRLVGPKKRWPPSRAAKLVRRLALALKELHAKGVIHRDLKPHNIMVQGSGEPKLMDFGLARSLGGNLTSLTSTGEMVGTPGYIAPEQMAGDAKALGPWTDVYSLGVILYEVLTGSRPFEAQLVAALYHQIQSGPPPSPSTLRLDMPRGVDGVCLKALAKEPADRYGSMPELAVALSEFLAP